VTGSSLPSTAPVGPAGISVGPELASRRAHRLRETIRNIRAQRSARIGLALLAGMLLIAIFADVIATYDPTDQLNGPGEPGRRAPPCIHLFGCPADQMETYLGTDGNSRDVFSRTIHGSRISLWVGLLTVGMAIFAGVAIGSVAGFTGGATDNVLMRSMDVVLAFPALILAIAVVTFLGPGIVNGVLAITIVSVPIYARIMRSSVLSVREHDYVTASRALGEGNRGILMRRILPNSLTPIIVAGTLGIATAVLEFAALSFLGLGAQPPTAEWGAMIGADFNSIFTAPLLVLAPGIALTITVLAFNLFGDGLRDALDPRLNR
jgi:ABC-type dipeptide/oligopeptide/nickel transport system permease subunit